MVIYIYILVILNLQLNESLNSCHLSFNSLNSPSSVWSLSTTLIPCITLSIHHHCAMLSFIPGDLVNLHVSQHYTTGVTWKICWVQANNSVKILDDNELFLLIEYIKKCWRQQLFTSMRNFKNKIKQIYRSVIIMYICIIELFRLMSSFKNYDYE